MILYLLACSEYVIDAGRNIEPVDTNTQPAEDPSGSVPNWADCPTGYSGMYYNLPEHHADVEPENEEIPISNYEVLDWWSAPYLSFVRFDGSLDYGENWWPIDDGFAGDPSYFAVAWYAWIRIYENTTVDFVVGASDDLWITIQDEVVYTKAGISPYDPQVVQVNLQRGQYPIEIHYAHRSGSAAFSFRLASENAVICYPEFEDEDNETED